MNSRELPARPNLEHLKKQAKALLHAALAGDAEAINRFSALPSLNQSNLALHDAQSVIAREHGFPSWNALREEVEARNLSRSAAIDEFIRCATGSASGRAERLLALYPDIATATLHTALVLGDAATVDAHLRKHPELATQSGGPQNWEPLLYLCHSCLRGNEPSRVAIARQLLTLGANPNGEYHWNWHPELPRTALWAAVCAVSNLPLAELLLEAGANPTDGVATHIAGGGGNLDALELLLRYSVNVNGIENGVPPLVYMMTWANNPAGPRWLLEHGADPNLGWKETGEAPLHVAARRWDVYMVELLVHHGADVSRRRADGCTPHTLASMQGNASAAKCLLDHGAQDELSTLDRFAAACASADLATAQSMLAAQPGLRTDLRPEHHLMLQRPAENGDAAVLETMLACGFNPNSGDKDNVTPLHRAAMGGHPAAVQVLLKHGARVDAVDGMFAASPLVWAVEGRRHATQPESEYIEAARLLIAAGCPMGWTPPDGAPSPEGTLEALDDLCRLASAGS